MRPRNVSSRLGTEFGTSLLTVVVHTPGAIAGVLSDRQGDAIDFVHDREEIDALDVQLLAAQLGQPLLALDRTCTRAGVIAPVTVVETSRYGFLASLVATSYVVAVLIEHRANVGRALRTFTRGRDALDAMLR